MLYGAGTLALDLGRWEEALALLRRAVELDPLNTQPRVHLAVAAYYAGHADDALATLAKVLELEPERQFAHTLVSQVYLAQSRPQQALADALQEPDRNLRLSALALSYHALGRGKEADAALAELIADYHDGSAFQIAEVYAFRGETDRAFQWLDRAYTQRDAGLNWIKGDPLLKNIASAPRYAAFLKKMRLPPD